MIAQGPVSGEQTLSHELASTEVPTEEFGVILFVLLLLLT